MEGEAGINVVLDHQHRLDLDLLAVSVARKRENPLPGPNQRSLREPSRRA